MSKKGKRFLAVAQSATGLREMAMRQSPKLYGVKIPALGSKEVQSLDDAALKKIISEGKGKMQPVKLSDAES